jgi:hypothetical protein
VTVGNSWCIIGRLERNCGIWEEATGGRSSKLEGGGIACGYRRCG